METDKFQPMSLLVVLKGYLKDTNEKILSLEQYRKDEVIIDELHLATLQGVVIGLSWAIAEIIGQAVASDRFTA